MRKTAIALAALATAAVLAGCATGPAAAGPAKVTGRTAGTASARTASSSTTSSSTTSSSTTSSSTTSSSTTSCNPYASLSPQPGGPADSGGSWAAHIKARGYLIAGVDQTTYHFGYLNPLDGQIEGFDIDMIRDVAGAIFGISPASSALDSHIHFKAISDADRIPDIQQGTVDIVAHTMTVNCQRLTEVDFSTIYYDANAQILVNKPASGAAPTLTQLGARHAPVCATSGSDDLAIISAAHATPVPETYWSDCLVLLEEGQVAGVVTDNSILYGMQAQDPDTVVTGSSLESEPYGLAISKDHPDFVRFVNAVLARALSDGQWLASCRQWVSSTCQLPSWPIDYVS